MEKRPISDMIESTMQKVREMIDANTIIGQPISTADGITLIPVSKITFGLGGGGGSDTTKKQEANDGFGGGIGVGVNIMPVAFIVAHGDSVKLLHVSPPAVTTLDRLIETVPEVIDKVAEYISKGKDKDKD